MIIVSKTEINPYKITNTIVGYSDYGPIYSGYDADGMTPVLINEFPYQAAKLIGIEQIKHRLNTLQQDHDTLLKTKDVKVLDEKVFIIYRNDKDNVVPIIDYLKGKTLNTKLNLFKKLCLSVEAMHSKAAWHGGLVPEYVWIDFNGDIKLMTMITDLPFSYHKNLCNGAFIEYFAPELYKMHPFNSRSDIFSLGVLFYKVLTDKTPFNSSAKYTNLIPPSHYNEEITNQLDRMILKMIHVKPGARYQWITEVIQELNLLMGTFNDKKTTLEHKGAQFLFYPEFNGQDNQIKQLTQKYKDVLNGMKSSVLIVGESGTVQESLINEVSGTYPEVDFVIGYAKEHTPYSAIEEIITKLLNFCFNFYVNNETMKNIGYTYLSNLTKVFPKLSYLFEEQLKVNHSQETLNWTKPEKIMLDFLKVYIQNSEHIFLKIFDVHYLDKDSLNLLNQLVSDRDTIFGLIGISNESSNLSLFKEQIELKPLSMESYTNLVRSRFGRANFIDQEFIHWLKHHSQDSLEKSFQIIDYLAGSNQVILKNQMWQLTGQSIDELYIPQDERSIVDVKVNQLPEKAKLVAHILSLLKGSLYQDDKIFKVVTEVAGLNSAKELIGIINYLEDEGIIVKMMLQYKFTNNHMKESVNRSIDEGLEGILHNQIARAYDNANLREFGKMAYHYNQSRDVHKAIFYYTLEAKRCLERNLYSEAEEYLKTTIRLYDHIQRECPRTLHLRLAKTYEDSGRLVEASELFIKIYNDIGSLKALTRFGFNCINSSRYNVLAQYIEQYKEFVNSDHVSLMYKLDMKIVLAQYYMGKDRDDSYIKDLHRYHRDHEKEIKRDLSTINYLRWIYNIHVLLMNFSDISWDQISHYLYEAESIARKENIKRHLMLIYNVFAESLRNSDLIKSKEYYLTSLDLASELGDLSNAMVAQINLVDCCRLLGNSYRSFHYAEQAYKTAELINYNDTELQINEAKHFLFIQDYTRTEQLIKQIKIETKKNKQTLRKIQAFLLQFEMYLDKHQYKRVRRMWPAIQELCKQNNLKEELLILEGKYNLLFENYGSIIQLYDQETSCSLINTELYIKQQLILFETYMMKRMAKKAIGVAESLKSFIYDTGYFSYLGHIHFYMGKLNQSIEDFIQANLNYKRALIWYRRLNHEVKVVEVNSILDSAYVEMSNQLLNDSGNTLRSDDHIKALVGKVLKERDEMVEALTDNEVIIDSINRINTNIMIEPVSKSFAAVLFENFLFDRFHLYINNDNKKYFQVDSQLQFIGQPCDLNISECIEMIMHTNRMESLSLDGKHLTGFPILSGNQQLIAILILENETGHITLTQREVQFISKLCQLISSTIDKGIMYESLIRDDLTGLFNRNFFFQKFENEFSKAKKYEADVSFLMIDLDNFSYVNNVHGHNTGDRILKKVADNIQTSIRKSDIAGRFGGEEFIVILPNTTGYTAKVIANQILSKISEINVDKRYNTTASIGVACLKSDKPNNIQELIEYADQAEIYAKSTGKNKVVCSWEMKTTQQTVLKI